MMFVKRRSSETIKYASNSFLAIKIHYINEMANFCEKAGADVYEVAAGMGADSRIGPKFLNPGPGYGGSCFPKDTNAMAYMGRMNGVNLSLIEAAIKGNEQRKKDMAKRILDAVSNQKTPKIAVLGLAFKGGTDDCRESPAMAILNEILAVSGPKVTVFDPKAMENAKKLLGNKVQYAPDAYEAAKGADVLAILTEWNQFKKLDLQRLATTMHHKRIVDLRNTFRTEDLAQAGFEFTGVGK